MAQRRKPGYVPDVPVAFVIKVGIELVLEEIPAALGAPIFVLAAATDLHDLISKLRIWIDTFAGPFLAFRTPFQSEGNPLSRLPAEPRQLFLCRRPSPFCPVSHEKPSPAF